MAYDPFAFLSQAETVFSMIKQNLGDFLRGKSAKSRQRDLLLRAVTHNVSLALP